MPVYSIDVNGRRFDLLNPHVPKTGGTTVESFFHKLGFSVALGKENAAIRDIMRCPPQHYHYDILDKLLILKNIQYSFIVVRHPLNRLLSDYKWAMTKSTMSDSHIQFDEWVDHVFKNYNLDRNYLANHIRPQYFFNGPHIHKVHKYEDGLENVLLQVMSAIGITFQGDFRLEKLNTSQDYNDIYAENIEIKSLTKEKIMKFYKRDFKEFGYSLD